MSVYNAIKRAAYYIAALRGYVNGTYLLTRNVWLIGTTIAPLLYNVQVQLGYTVNTVDDIADAFWDFRNEIVGQMQNNGAIKDLLYYADVLISFARDPGWIVKQGINKYYPEIIAIAKDASGFILNILQTRTGLTGAFLADPGAFIRAVLFGALGEARRVIDDPRGFIIDKLTTGLSGLRMFFTDPRAYLFQEVRDLYPDLSKFLRDPDGYILDKVVNGFERMLNTYWQRLAKIAENILNRMF